MGDTDGGNLKSEAARWSLLLRWLDDKQGMDTSQLAVEARSVEGAGRGLFATKLCSPSTSLFTIPKNALLNLNTLRPLYPQSSETRLSAVQIISLHLLLHRPVGEEDSLDPAFGPYISTLPRSFASHPLTWLVNHPRKGKTPEGLFLRNLPPSASDVLHTLYARFLEDYQTICLYLNKHRHVLDISSRPKAEFPKPYGTSSSSTLVADYCWAWLNVNTRSIYYPVQGEDPQKNCLTLCPVLDFANHSETSSHIIPALESGLRSPGARTAGDFTFKSCTDATLEAGQQLYLRYGGHSNRTLFVEYGFVNSFEPEAIARGEFRGEVDVQDLVEECIRGLKPTHKGGHEASALQQWLMDTLEEDGYWGEWTLDPSPPPAHPSYRLITALRLIQLATSSEVKTGVLSESATQTWRDVLSGHRELISEDNERGWRDILLGICNRVSQRAQEGLDQTTRDLSGLEGWQAWMRENVLCLWREELVVADAVARSLRAGEVF